jgi:beta-phosphoglucomutase-like phosphatase (HAD superfamily)
VAIVSGSPRVDVQDGVELLGIAPLLRFFLGSEDYPRGKPDPAGFLLAAQRLGAAPADCLVFEDSAAGVRAARAAGMRCVALARPGAPAQDLSDADLVLNDLGGFSPDALPAPRPAAP